MKSRWQTLCIVAAITTTTYVVAASIAEPREEFAETNQETARAKDPVDPFAGAFYVGVDACVDCHESKVDSYKKTSHFRAMLTPGIDPILGHYDPDENNIMRTRRDELRYEMTQDDRGYYQTSIEVRPHGTERRTEQIDLVMGSGKLAQSFLYWQDRALFQLPLVFFTPLEVWTNAPGFLDTWPQWTREITPRCLECHSTYFEQVPGSQNAYFHDTMVMRITCERCHGPGSKHVDFHYEEPTAEARYIVDPRELSRERHLEICSQCHGSIGTPVKPSFSYVPGKPLGDYLEYSNDDGTTALVHTVNQLQRLEQSECFKHSSMTCIDCHDPHLHERDDLQTFSERCITCHEVEHCGVSKRLGDSIAENCIDCHMPRRDDASTPFYLAAGDDLKLLQLRDHLVAIYPEASAELEARWSDPERDKDTNTRARLHAQAKIVYAELTAAETAILGMQYKEAVMRLDRALGVDATRDDVRLRLAWLLATAPQDSLRDGPRALKLVEALADSTTIPEWTRQDVLAAALAETGDFEAAIETAKEAAQASPAVEQGEIKARAVVYEKKKPFRLDAPARPKSGPTLGPEQ